MTPLMYATDTPQNAYEVSWSGVSLSLRELSKQVPLPVYVRVTKGTFMNIGPARISHYSDLLLHSVQTTAKVLAHTFKVKEKRRRTKLKQLQQKISLPLTYKAWFEILSEEGKSVPPIRSVRELVRLNPCECLVREPIKANLEDSNGQVALDRTVTVAAGERLKLLAEVNVTYRGKTGSVKYLQCANQHQQNVFLHFDVKGSFSPIGNAEADEPNGVYTIKELVENFRLPFMVRLLNISGAAGAHSDLSGAGSSGARNKKLNTGSNSSIAFRLELVYSDETAFLYPLSVLSGRDRQVIPVATHVGALRFSYATNMQQQQQPAAAAAGRVISNSGTMSPLLLSSSYSASSSSSCLTADHQFTDYVKRISSVVDGYLNCIHFLIEAQDTLQRIQESRLSQRRVSAAALAAKRRLSLGGASSSSAGRADSSTGLSGAGALSNLFRGRTEEDRLFQEIDIIYMHVRMGGSAVDESLALVQQTAGLQQPHTTGSGSSIGAVASAGKSKGWRPFLAGGTRGAGHGTRAFPAKVAHSFWSNEEPAYEMLDKYNLKPFATQSLDLPIPRLSRQGRPPGASVPTGGRSGQYKKHNAQSVQDAGDRSASSCRAASGTNSSSDVTERRHSLPLREHIYDQPVVNGAAALVCAEQQTVTEASVSSRSKTGDRSSGKKQPQNKPQSIARSATMAEATSAAAAAAIYTEPTSSAGAHQANIAPTNTGNDSLAKGPVSHKGAFTKRTTHAVGLNQEPPSTRISKTRQSATAMLPDQGSSTKEPQGMCRVFPPASRRDTLDLIKGSLKADNRGNGGSVSGASLLVNIQ